MAAREIKRNNIYIATATYSNFQGSLILLKIKKILRIIICRYHRWPTLLENNQIIH